MPLLEREALLRSLHDHVVDALAGRGRLVLVSGEAGIGKTAVLDEFAGALGPGVEPHIGWCDPLSTPRPFGPWQDIASGLSGGLRARLDTARRDRSGAAELLHPVLEAVTGGAPKVLILEDLHWADEATLDLLRLLARRAGRHKVLLVASYRDDEIAGDHPLRGFLANLAGLTVHRHPVAPLSPRAVESLAADHAVDAGELHRVTGGNPFFVTEVLAVGGRGVPPTVVEAVAGRLDRVSPSGRRVAEVLAVLGSASRSELLAELVEDTTTGTSELCAVGLLRRAGSAVWFRHELARTAVLDGLPTDEQARLQATVYEALLRHPKWSGDDELLAHHAEAAGAAEAVLRHAPAAAANAVAVGAHRTAAAQYRRALRGGGALPPRRRAELLESLAQASAIAGRLPDTHDALVEAIELRQSTGDRIRLGDDLRWQSFVLWPMGRCSEARRAGLHAVEVLEQLEPSLQLADAHLNVCANAVFDQHGLDLVQRHADPAIALARRLGDERCAIQAAFFVAAARFNRAERGDEDPGWEEMRRTCARVRQAGHTDPAAFMAMLMALFAVNHRDRERAEEAFGVLATLSDERELINYTSTADGHRALGKLHQGSWDEAAALAEAVLAIPGPPAVARLFPLVVLGLVRARRGASGAWEALDEAQVSFEPTGWMVLLAAARAEAAWLAGDTARAADEVRRGLADTGPHTDPWVTGELARWAVLAGDPPPRVRIAPPYALELSGDWRSAAATWEQLGCSYDAGLARLAGDVSALVQAVHAFDALGARPAVGIAKARLREHGERVGTRGPRGSTRANPHGLTNRELEILQHMRSGLTGAEIAARLHLSPKTVRQHVSTALAKLGVRTRAEAVAKLAE